VTRDELLEYGGMVKALDVVVRRLPDALWPLCIPAERILYDVEETRYTCPMCRSAINSHHCACPVTGARRGLRLRARRSPPCR
jgi:hypothetical protein